MEIEKYGLEEYKPVTWSEIDSDIPCPFQVNPADCREKRGRDEKTLSHSATLYISECIKCEKKSAYMGDTFNPPPSDSLR